MSLIVITGLLFVAFVSFYAFRVGVSVGASLPDVRRLVEYQVFTLLLILDRLQGQGAPDEHYSLEEILSTGGGVYRSWFRRRYETHHLLNRMEELGLIHPDGSGGYRLTPMGDQWLQSGRPVNRPPPAAPPPGAHSS